MLLSGKRRRSGLRSRVLLPRLVSWRFLLGGRRRGLLRLCLCFILFWMLGRRLGCRLLLKVVPRNRFSIWRLLFRGRIMVGLMLLFDLVRTVVRRGRSWMVLVGLKRR